MSALTRYACVLEVRKCKALASDATFPLERHAAALSQACNSG